MNPLALTALSTAAGVVLRIVYDSVKEKYRFRRELKENNQIDLTGTNWIAAWQTSVDLNEVLNTEELIIQQKGRLVKIHNREKSKENLKAGYKWQAQLRFFHGRDLMGEYFSLTAEQNTNKGIMYFCYDSPKKQLIGRWVGSSYDGPLLSGFGVISRSKAQSLEVLKKLIEKHPEKVPIISYAM